MTARKSTLRPRRRGRAGNVPESIAQWFAGELPPDPEPLLRPRTEEQLAYLRTIPPDKLSREERRALGLPVEPLRPVPMLALIYPDSQKLAERWRTWKAEHPGARPPVGYEWLDDPSPSQTPEWLTACAAVVPRRRGR